LVRFSKNSAFKYGIKVGVFYTSFCWRQGTNSTWDMLFDESCCASSSSLHRPGVQRFSFWDLTWQMRMVRSISVFLAYSLNFTCLAKSGRRVTSEVVQRIRYSEAWQHTFPKNPEVWQPI